MQPKLFYGDHGGQDRDHTRMLYKDNASSIQQNASIAADPEIDEVALYEEAVTNADLAGQEEDGQVRVAHGASKTTANKNSSIAVVGKTSQSLQQRRVDAAGGAGASLQTDTLTIQTAN